MCLPNAIRDKSKGLNSHTEFCFPEEEKIKNAAEFFIVKILDKINIRIRSEASSESRIIFFWGAKECATLFGGCRLEILPSL